MDLDAVLDEASPPTKVSIAAVTATSSGGEMHAAGAAGGAPSESPATTGTSSATSVSSGEARVTHAGIPQTQLCALPAHIISSARRRVQAWNSPAAAASHSPTTAAANPDTYSSQRATIEAVHQLAQRHSVCLLASSRSAVIAAGADPGWFSTILPKPPRWRTLHEVLRPTSASGRRAPGNDSIGADTDDAAAGQVAALTAVTGAALDARFSTLRVLVADDNSVNQKLAVRLLAKLGVKDIGPAVDGLEAVEKVRAGPRWGEALSRA